MIYVIIVVDEIGRNVLYLIRDIDINVAMDTLQLNNRPAFWAKVNSKSLYHVFKEQGNFTLVYLDKY